MYRYILVWQTKHQTLTKYREKYLKQKVGDWGEVSKSKEKKEVNRSRIYVQAGALSVILPNINYFCHLLLDEKVNILFQLLSCFAIPVVLLLSWVYLKSRYKHILFIQNLILCVHSFFLIPNRYTDSTNTISVLNIHNLKEKPGTENSTSIWF